jgi:Peptidase family S41
MKRALAVALVFAAVEAGAAAPAPGAADDPARAVAAGAGAKLVESYVYPARARAAADTLARNAAAGAYDGLREAALATRLTDDVYAVLHDKHVRLRYSADTEPPEPSRHATPGPAVRAAQLQRARQIGYGLGRVAHLPGNVGYLDVRGFPDANDELDAVFDGAVNSIAYSDAIVLDLRRNHGGSPDSVARLLSHFFAPKTHLNDFVGRGDGDPNVVESTYTETVPGPRITAPLYVLISGETFSGGEECAYDVQALRRGTLIGAATGGGANPGEMRRIDDHFLIFVPTERARNPVTKTNWEGAGVKPDVEVPRERALVTAYGMAVDARLRDTSLPAAQRAALTQLRAKIDAMSDADVFAL